MAKIDKITSLLRLETDGLDWDSEPYKKFVLAYRNSTNGGYNENDIAVARYSDGSLSVANGESFVYLYSQQIKHLKKILAMRPPSKFKGAKKARKFQETARRAE